MAENFAQCLVDASGVALRAHPADELALHHAERVPQLQIALLANAPQIEEVQEGIGCDTMLWRP